MTTDKATPRPWHCGPFRELGAAPGIDIGNADGGSVCRVLHDGRYDDSPETKANAELIVRAVNNHEELAEVVRRAVWLLQQAHYPGRERDEAAVLGEARAALAKLDAS